MRYTRAVADDQVVVLVYTDDRGVRSTRRVVPERIWYGRTDWHPEPQWLLEAYDLGRHVLRSFPLRQIKNFVPDTGGHVPDGPPAAGAAGRVPVRG